MSTTPDLVQLPGTQPRPVANLRLLEPAAQNQNIKVTVYVRPKRSGPSVPVRQLTHEEYEAQMGADRDDVRQVEKYARECGLTVLESNPSRRSIALSGNVSAFSQAFGVDIVKCELDGSTYRCTTGPIKVPPHLAGAITGVFGLDDLPMVQRR
jgi:subtilase family serine protease